MGCFDPHPFLTCGVTPIPLLQVSAVFKSQRSPQARSWNCVCTWRTLTRLGHHGMKVMGPLLGVNLGIPEQGELGGMESSPQWGCPSSTAGILGSLQSEVWEYSGLVEATQPGQGGINTEVSTLQTPRLSLLLLPGARFRASLEEPAASLALCVPECTKAKRFLQSPVLQPRTSRPKRSWEHRTATGGKRNPQRGG